MAIGSLIATATSANFAFMIASKIFMLALSFLASNPDNVEEKIQWISFEKAVELQKDNPKKVLIDMYTDWCHWCKVMDKNTFKHPKVASYINENFYAVKLDGEYKGDIEFDNHTFKFVQSGRRGYHELAAAITNGQLSYPTIVFMDEKMRIITLLPGYKDAKGFEPIMNFVATGAYEVKSWDEFSASFESQLD